MSFPDAYVPVPGNYSPQERDNLFASIPGKLDKAGGTMTGAISMGGNKITNVANGTSSADAVNKSQLDGKLSLSGGTMTGAIAMGNNKITGLATPTADADAATKKYVDDHSGGGGTDITNLAPAFSTSTKYYKGQYVTYDGQLYRFTETHNAGAWNSGHVTADYAAGCYVNAGQTANNAMGTRATAEGSNCKASGSYSHAEGSSCTATGLRSHAQNNGCTATHADQHVFGAYNKHDPSSNSATTHGNWVEIVGNGESTARSNARTLDWNGNEQLAGQLYVGADTSDNVLDDSKRVPTASALAPAFSTSINYKKGQYVTYNGKVYRFTNNLPAGPWEPIAVEQVTSTGQYVTAGSDGTQIGNYSTAAGYQTQAKGNYADANGYNTKANSDYQHVFGRTNIEDTSGTYVEIVGNGALEASNARTLDWNGNEELAGKLVAMSNENELINWYFINPVNQLGIALNTTVSATDPTSYFIDGWKLTSGTATLTSNGILLQGTMTQAVERAPSGTVSASVMTSSFLQSATASYSNGVFTISAIEATIVAAKLERGGKQTLYRSIDAGGEINYQLLDKLPNITTELLKCQRYLYVLSGALNTGLRVLGLGIATSATTIVLPVQMPVPMLSTPTLTTSGLTGSNLFAREDYGITNIQLSSPTIKSFFATAQQVSIEFTTSGTLTAGKMYPIVLQSGALILTAS